MWYTTTTTKKKREGSKKTHPLRGDPSIGLQNPRVLARSGRVVHRRHVHEVVASAEDRLAVTHVPDQKLPVSRQIKIK